jgi:hypothetical protein
MENLEIEITPDDILIMKIDLKKDLSFTRRRRSVRISSTEGNCQLWRDGQPHPKKIRLNLNVFRSLTREELQELSSRS